MTVRAIVPAESGYGRDFRLYATGQAVSVLGDRIALIALVFLVVHLSQAYAPALAAFYLCRLVPSLLGGLLAGVVVDQFDRRRLMIICDLGRAVLLVLVPALGPLQLWVLFPMVLVLFALTFVFDAASRAALPDVVPGPRLLGANAILQSIDTAADIGYAVGGTLIFLLGFHIPFYLDAASFVFSAVMITGMRIPRQATRLNGEDGSLWQRIREGVLFLFTQPFLRWTTYTFVFAPFAGGAVFVLTPLYANTVLGSSSGLFGPLTNGAFRFSLLEVSVGVGALAGSLVAGRLAQRLPRGTLFGVGITGMGVANLFMFFATNVYAATLVMIVSGLCNSLFVVSGTTLLQQLTPSGLRGRVFSARTTVINASLALGSASAGALLLVVSYRTMWILLGGIIVASSLFVWLRPDVRSQP